MNSIKSVLKRRNLFRKHGFKLFRVFGIINMFIHYFGDIMATFLNIATITIFAIHLEHLNQQFLH